MPNELVNSARPKTTSAYTSHLKKWEVSSLTRTLQSDTVYHPLSGTCISEIIR
jgi:hypothetical protein